MAARKVVIVGDFAVGKTSLVRRLVSNTFSTDYIATINVEITPFEMTLPGDPGGAAVELALWDIDGNFRELVLGHSYLKGAKAAVIVADASRHATIELLERLRTGLADALPGVPQAALVNKQDLLADEADREAQRARLAGLSLPVFETSAKSSLNVVEAFAHVATTLRRRGS